MIVVVLKYCSVTDWSFNLRIHLIPELMGNNDRVSVSARIFPATEWQSDSFNPVLGISGHHRKDLADCGLFNFEDPQGH